MTKSVIRCYKMLKCKKESNFWKKHRYETKWQIKMKWSRVRTIILMYNKNARDEPNEKYNKMQGPKNNMPIKWEGIR